MASIQPTQIDCPAEWHAGKGAFLRLNITSISDSDAATNKRYIGTSVTIQGTPWVTLYSWSVKLGGQVITENIISGSGVTNWHTGQVLASRALTFDNDYSGNLTVQAYVKQVFYYKVGSDLSRWNDPSIYQLNTANCVCSQLLRYTSFSIHDVDNTTLTTATIKWSAPDAVDMQEYSLDDGEWISFTGSSYTLTGFEPGSTHKVRTRIRRKDSQLITTSDYLNFTLKSLPEASIQSDINIGSKQTVSISSMSYITKWSCEVFDGTTKIKEDNDITTISKEIDISSTTIVNEMLARHSNDNEWNLTYKFKVVANDTIYNLEDKTAKIIIPAGSYTPTYDVSSISYKVTNALSNDITGSNQKIIKGISNVTYYIGEATPNGHASMSRYIISTGDKSVSINSAPSMSADISAVSSKSFSVQAVDSRGRSTTISKDYNTYIDYFKPSVTSYNIVRKDAVLANLVFNISGKFCNWSGLQVSNTISSVKYQYKIKGSSTYSEEIECKGITIDGDSFNILCTGTGELINIANEYDIKVNIYDRLSSVSFTTFISTGRALLWRDLANTRIGIGHKPNYSLDVNGNINGNDILAKGSSIIPIDITNSTETLLSRVQYLGTNDIHMATWFSRNDDGTKNISDKPTGENKASFVCSAICNKRYSSNDYRYILECYVKGSSNPYKAVVDNNTQSIDWSNTPSGGGDSLPIGTMIPYPSNVIPNGFLPCDGGAVSRTTYADLFSVIGTSYGAGDGSTTFNLPNKKGRISVGLDSSQTEFNTIGKRDGEKTHQLTINEMPSHDHRLTPFVDIRQGDGQTNSHSGSLGTHLGGYVSKPNTLVTPTGGDQPHNNLQPYEVDQWIIKAFNGAYNQPVSGDVNDTLPVGSIIKFDGDYIPEGYEEVEDNEHTYSTEEKVVGTWVDGKPLYRKSYIIKGITTVSYTFSLAGLNMDMCFFDFTHSIFKQDVFSLPFGIYGSNTDYNRIFFQNNNSIVFQFGSIYTMSKDLYFTLEYTKTTD